MTLIILICTTIHKHKYHLLDRLCVFRFTYKINTYTNIRLRFENV